MTEPFQYSDEDWQAVEGCLAKLVPDASAAERANWRHRIESIVNQFLREAARYDPRSPEVIAKEHWKNLAIHLQGALDALASLEAIYPWDIGRLNSALARNPWDEEEADELPVWKEAV